MRPTWATRKPDSTPRQKARRQSGKSSMADESAGRRSAGLLTRCPDQPAGEKE